MKIIRTGNSRTVILIGPLALKFIRINFLPLLKAIIKKNFQKKQDPIALKLRWGYIKFMFAQGIIANISEWATYSSLRKRFLAPTYLTLGIVNISKRIRGKSLEKDEISSMLSVNPEASLEEHFRLAELHATWNSDWFKTRTGIVLVDYGDIFRSTGLPISFVLSRKREEIQRALDTFFLQTSQK